MIWLASLISISLSLANNVFADDKLNLNITFQDLNKKIQKNEICEIKYNPSKSAAIVNVDCGSAYYINFKNKQTFSIIDHASNIFPIWIGETIARIESPCGTGCTQSTIFFAPDMLVSCSMHEYRIKNLSQDEPPDYYNNTPLLIDAKKKLYVCYVDDNNIKVYPFPVHASIHSLKGYFSEKASIQNGELFIIYKNRQGVIKKISYGKI